MGSRVFDVAVVTSKQLSANPWLTGPRWTSLLSLMMTQSQIFELSNSKPNSNIVTQLIMKIKARVSSQQKQYPVKIPVQRCQSIYLNPSVGGLCQNCSNKLRTEWRAHWWSEDTVTWGWCGGGRGLRPLSPSEARPWRRLGQNTASSGQTRTRGGSGSIE